MWPQLLTRYYKSTQPADPADYIERTPEGWRLRP